MPLELLSWRLARRFWQDVRDREPVQAYEVGADVPRGVTVSAPRCRLRVLSHNLWGFPIAPFYPERLAHFCDVLGGRALLAAVHAACLTACLPRAAANAAEWDVVALQEVWFWQEREALRAAARRGGLAFSYHFKHGIGVPIWPNQSGTGLFVLSRFPIVEAVYRRFEVNGCVRRRRDPEWHHRARAPMAARVRSRRRPYRFDHMDAQAGRGCALVRVLKPGFAVPLDVYITHLISCYSDFPFPTSLQEVACCAAWWHSLAAIAHAHTCM